jgi:hypothetical protein
MSYFPQLPKIPSLSLNFWPFSKPEPVKEIKDKEIDKQKAVSAPIRIQKTIKKREYQPSIPQLRTNDNEPPMPISLLIILVTINSEQLDLASALDVEEFEEKDKLYEKAVLRNMQKMQELSEKIQTSNSWVFYKDVASTFLTASSLFVSTTAAIAGGGATLLVAGIGDITNEIMQRTEMTKKLASYFTDNKETQEIASTSVYLGIKLFTSILSLNGIKSAGQIYEATHWLRSASSITNKAGIIASGYANYQSYKSEANVNYVQAQATQEQKMTSIHKSDLAEIMGHLIRVIKYENPAIDIAAESLKINQLLIAAVSA